MTLTFCRIFSTIVTQGNFLRAAEALHMTPSAVSHAVADAEGALGFRLFSRTRNGVTLTENGRELYPAVLQLLHSENALNQTVDTLNGLRGGSVSLGVFNSVCTNWMPEVFRRFGALYPDIRVNVYEGSYDDVVRWLKSGVADLGFLSTSCTTELPVDGRYVDPLVCLVPPDFPSREPGFITLREMTGQQFIIQREGSDADVQMLFRKHDLRFHSSCHVLDDTSVMAMVACKRGISIMPELTARGLEGDLKVLRVKPEEHRVIGLSALDWKALSPAAARLRACINTFMDERGHAPEKPPLSKEKG